VKVAEAEAELAKLQPNTGTAQMAGRRRKGGRHTKRHRPSRKGKSRKSRK
jgi:hypothetical protein